MHYYVYSDRKTEQKTLSRELWFMEKWQPREKMAYGHSAEVQRKISVVVP